MRADEYLQVVSPEEILIRGTRVPLETVVREYLEGSSAEDIAAEYPGIGLDRVYA